MSVNGRLVLTVFSFVCRPASMATQLQTWHPLLVPFVAVPAEGAPLLDAWLLAEAALVRISSIEAQDKQH